MTKPKKRLNNYILQKETHLVTKVKINILLILMLLSINCISQNEITIGRSVHIDGIIEEGEWCDAKIYLFETNDNVKTKVLLKHDGNNLLIAYINEEIVDTTYLYPEIFIDTKLNKGENWQTDDYWFHVSAQDCYCKGERENYKNCRPDYTKWRASPNHPFGKTYEAIGTFEIAIPFKMMGIKLWDKIGICFSQVLQPDNIRLNYPISSHEDKPNTWGEFYITGADPEMFAQGLVSMDDRWDLSLSFTPDESEVFYTVKYPEKSMQIFSRKWENNQWGSEYEPNLLIDKANTYAMEPFPSIDGTKLFYTVCDSLGCDIWYASKENNQWVNPKKLDSELNNDVAFYSTFFKNNDMLYTNVSKRKTYLAKYNDGKYDEFAEAGIGGAHAYPSPDGNFILVNSRGEYGRSDIFVYFKNEDGSWSKPINLGAKVNTEHSESCPSLSPDGKILYFNRHSNNENDDYDMYWMDASYIQTLKPRK